MIAMMVDACNVSLILLPVNDICDKIEIVLSFCSSCHGRSNAQHILFFLGMALAIRAIEGLNASYAMAICKISHTPDFGPSDNRVVE